MYVVGGSSPGQRLGDPAQKGLGKRVRPRYTSETLYITTPLQGAVSCDCSNDPCLSWWLCPSFWGPARRGRPVLAPAPGIPVAGPSNATGLMTTMAPACRGPAPASVK